jgi:hypothetical protein
VITRILAILFICSLWSVACAVLARRKRRSALTWFLLGFCFWFIPLIALARLRKLPLPELDVAVFPSSSFHDTSLSNSRFL